MTIHLKSAFNVVTDAGSRQNKLLAALPQVEWYRLQRHLDPIRLLQAEILREADSYPEYAYFPTTSIISVVDAEADGASTEVSSVGNEGLLGIAIFLGGETTPRQAIVQSTGWAYRISAENLRSELDRDGALKHLLGRYTQALLTLVGQTAVCNRRHSIVQRMCRWLLLHLDRAASMEMAMTHEMLATLLGVRREGITDAACKLQTEGFITYHRGRITVIDRSGLESICCRCHGLVRREFDRLLTPGHPPGYRGVALAANCARPAGERDASVR